MKVVVCSIYDKKVGAFMLPFLVARSASEARRTFADAVVEPKSQFGMHPEDYALMEIGRFDDQDGSFEMQSAGAMPLMQASEVMPPG